MLSCFQNCYFVAHTHCALSRDWHHLHAKTADILACSWIDTSEASERPIRLRWVLLTSNLVHIRQFASCRSAGNSIFVKTNLDSLPSILVICLRAGDYKWLADASLLQDQGNSLIILARKRAAERRGSPLTFGI
jgi:hypothetical protein